MSTMTHEGFAARVEYSEEDGCFIGHIAGMQDVVGFHGESVAELKAAFEEAVEDYLETCRKLGREPSRPYSGQFRLRLAPEPERLGLRRDREEYFRRLRYRQSGPTGC